jgi:hypothetical protein
MEKPIGLEDHGREYTQIKIKHWIIKEHQRLFPDLADRMKVSNRATSIYIHFLVTLPFRIYDIINHKKIKEGIVNKEFTPELKLKLLKEYNLIK